MKKEYIHNLFIEKYKQNSEYIRHTEKIRLDHLKFYISFITVLFSVFAFLFSEELKDDTSTISSVVSTYYIFILLAGSITSVYGFIQNVFFLVQKRNYDHYWTNIKEIEKYYRYNLLVHGNTIIQPDIQKRGFRQIFTSAFFYWYCLMVSISTFPLATSLFV